MTPRCSSTAPTWERSRCGRSSRPGCTATPCVSSAWRTSSASRAACSCWCSISSSRRASRSGARGGAAAVTPDVRLQLALVFLLSNLLPALALTPVLGWCRRMLDRLIPDVPAATPGAPRYLTPQALGDPGTAILLLERELARLI